MLVTAATGSSSSFDDVPADQTHEDGIGWLVDHGVTIGCEPGAYCPSDPVRRDQMATFLWRLSGNAPGVPPSVDAATVAGMTPDELQGEDGAVGPQGPPGPPGTSTALSDEQLATLS